MKIKEIKKTVHLAWSPKPQHPIYVVAGTAAQQLDASFSTSAAIELYPVNLANPSLELQPRCAFKSEYRFHKLIWSDLGYIVGGCDAGRILIYDANKLLNNEIVDYERSPAPGNGLVACLDKHLGPVRALDFNYFLKNLLATGATKSQIFIWDLNKLDSSYMTPNTEALPPDDVTSLAWNKQVQHIIATSFSTRCLVWDLRKNEPIIELPDSSSKIRWKDVKWNPANAIQLCLASEEDQYPVTQLWDLRYASSPVKTFQGHQRGVLSVAWCNDDPDLLISCGKDDKLLVWNPNSSSATGEIVHEIPVSTGMNFEVNWCPRNPFLISSSSCDGIASILSLAGNGPVAQTNNMIADSFPGMNQYQQPVTQTTQAVNLGKPPKWMKKPVGVSFAFGGKLVDFGSQEKTVYVRQVVTESDLDMKFKELEGVLEQGNIYAHCLKKAEIASDPKVKNAWSFIASQCFGNDFKNQMYFLLGTSEPSLQEKLSNLNIIDDTNNEEPVDDTFSNVSRIGPADNDDIFGSIAAQQNSINSAPAKPPLKIAQTNDIEGAICDALLLGKIEKAVDLCLKEDRMTDAIILAMSGGPELIAKTQSKYFEKSENYLTTLISAVVTEDWCNIVETCDLSNWRQVLVALLTYTRDDEFRALCESLGYRLLTEGNESQKNDAVLCFICAGNVNQLIENWKPSRSGSAAEIQELAELGLLMKEAVKARNIDVGVTGPLAKVLLEYAELLTSQGYLREAYSYLGESQEESIQQLKDRLMFALGLKTFRTEVPTAKTGGYFQPQPATPYVNTFGAGANPSANYNCQPNYTNPPKSVVKPYNQINQVPPMPPSQSKSPVFGTSKPPNAPTPPSAPVKGYGPGQQVPFGNPTSTANLFPPQPPTVNSVVPTPPTVFNPPPTPTLFTPSSTITSAPQPSLFNPTAGFTNNPYNPPVSSAPPAMSMARATPTPPPPPPSSQVPYTSARQTPDHLQKTKYVLDPSVLGGGPQRNSFSNSFPSMPATMNQPPVNSVPPFPSQNDSSYYSMQNQNSFYPAPQQPQQHQHMNAYIPNSQIPGQILQPPVQPEIPKMPPLPTAAPGWNDPPSLAFEKPKPNQVGYVNPTPITHPLYGSAIPEENIVNHPPSSTNFPMNPQGGYVMPNTYHNEVVNQTTAPPMQNIDYAPKPKPALPEQHIHIQTVLEELRNQCHQKTANPQMKRKLDDVARKLEMLYDAIRESKLSQPTLQGLHDIINAIQHGNYQECLALHTRLVSGPDFSTIASFMPGIKVLVQSAMQLDVYL